MKKEASLGVHACPVACVFSAVATRGRRTRTQEFAMMRTKRGFTLVELLVVIGIIALLVSILLPTLNRARTAAKRVQCASNLSQVGRALYIYADSYKGSLPPDPGASAPDAISCTLRDSAKQYGMARDIFYCPSRENPINLFPVTNKEEEWEKPTQPAAYYGGDLQITYSNLVAITLDPLFDEFGNAISQTDQYSVLKIPAKKNDLALFLDCMIFLPDRGWSPVPIYVSNHNKGTDSGGRFSPLEPVGGNVLYVDGHVEWKNISDTKLRFRMEPAHMDIYY